MLAVFLMNKDVYIAHIPNAPWFSSETLALLRLRLSSIFVDKSLTYLLTYLLPDSSWGRCPGRPRNRWLDQLRRDNSTPPADLWRPAVTRGHSGSDATVLDDYALTPVHTVAEKCDCRRIRRLSPLSRSFLRQSHFSATVWTGL